MIYKSANSILDLCMQSAQHYYTVVHRLFDVDPEDVTRVQKFNYLQALAKNQAFELLWK